MENQSLLKSIRQYIKVSTEIEYLKVNPLKKVVKPAVLMGMKRSFLAENSLKKPYFKYRLKSIFIRKKKIKTQK